MKLVQYWKWAQKTRREQIWLKNSFKMDQEEI